MAKLGEFTNPLSGQKGSIFNLGQLASMILGVLVLLVTFGAGTWLYNKAKNAPLVGGAVGTNSILSPRTPGATPVTNLGPNRTLHM